MTIPQLIRSGHITHTEYRHHTFGNMFHLRDRDGLTVASGGFHYICRHARKIGLLVKPARLAMTSGKA